MEDEREKVNSLIEILLDELHVSSVWNGGILLLAFFTLILYFFILPTGKNHTWWKSIIFIIGVFVAYMAIGSPLNIVARIQFSTHIIQLILLLLVAPPLLIIGFKTEIIHKALKFPIAKKIANILTKPYVAFILFFIFLTMLHVPAIFDAARMDIYTNYFYMFGLLFIAILYWIPIVTDICFERKQKLLYVGLSIFALIPVSLFLIFSTEGMYETYSDLGVFVDALEACFPPDEEPLPASFYESLLPSKPVQLQHVGGQILLGGGIVVFLITMLLVQVFEKRKATKK